MSRQVSTGKESQEHPLDDYFRELIALRRVTEAAGAAATPPAGAMLVHDLDRVALLPSNALGSSPTQSASSPVVARSLATENGELAQSSDLLTVRGAGSPAAAKLARAAGGERRCDDHPQRTECDSPLSSEGAHCFTT